MRHLTLALAALALSTPAAAQTAGDPVAGERVFNQCKTCHSFEAGKNLAGPNLAGLWGRKAGTVAGARYSPAMKASGIVWDAASLKTYLADPRKAMPGTTMMVGVRREKDLDDVIAYLEQKTKQSR